MWDFAKKMAIKAIQKQAAPFLTAHCPESLQPRLAELLADEQAISSLLSYLYDVGTGNKSFSLKELDFLPISSGSNSELLNYVVPSLVSKLPIKLSPSSRFGAEIKKMLIKLLQSQAAPYLLKKCPSALQAPLAQLLSDDAAISSIMSYIYDMATGEASFSMETLQQLPMTPATRKALSTPGLIKHVFTAIKPLLSSLPGKLSLPVPEEVSFTPADSPVDTDIYTTPESDRQTRSRETEQSDRSRSAGKKPTSAVEDDAPYSPEESTSSTRTEKMRSRRKASSRSSDAYSMYSDADTAASDSVGKIALLPALVAGGLTLSGVLSTFYTLYYSICYDPLIAFSVSSILGYVVLGVGFFLGNKWVLKPYRGAKNNGNLSEGESTVEGFWESFIDLFRSREQSVSETVGGMTGTRATTKSRTRTSLCEQGDAYRQRWLDDKSELSLTERGMCYAKALDCYSRAADKGDWDAGLQYDELERLAPDSIIKISRLALVISCILIAAGLVSAVYGLCNEYYGYIVTYGVLSANEIVCAVMGVGIFIGDEWVRKPWCKRRALRRGAAMMQHLDS